MRTTHTQTHTYRARTLAENGGSCAAFAAKVEKDYAWVSTEKAGFGSGDYDFSKYDMKKSKKDYAEVRESEEW